MKKNNTKKCIFFAVIILLFSLDTVVTAETNNRQANIKSYGRIMSEKQDGTMKGVIDASDLIYLADEIDDLENKYKSETLKGLNDISTFFMSNGSVTHDPSKNEVDASAASLLTFSQLSNAIKSSQSIPEADNSGSTIVGAIADNLSKGTAAWVDGALITGTGADNNSYYNQGYTDGLAELGNANVSYTYHQHTGNSSKEGGCYAACKAVKNTDTEPSDWYGKCPNCGAWGLHRGNKAINVIFSCGTIVKVNQHVICSSCEEPFHTYDKPNHKCYIISCGKTTDTIESATVIFNK